MNAAIKWIEGHLIPNTHDITPSLSPASTANASLLLELRFKYADFVVTEHDKE